MVRCTALLRNPLQPIGSTAAAAPPTLQIEINESFKAAVVSRSGGFDIEMVRVTEIILIYRCLKTLFSYPYFRQDLYNPRHLDSRHSKSRRMEVLDEVPCHSTGCSGKPTAFPLLCAPSERAVERSTDGL